MINKFSGLLASAAIATGTVTTLAAAPSASAFTVKAEDIGKSFTVKFDGNVNENDVTGLSSEATFTFLGFNTVGSKTEAAFDVLLANTSNGGITSRTSALGFNVSEGLLGVGNPSGAGNTRVSGLFTNDKSGSFPNQFGAIDVCFTRGNTCQGGANGGVTTGNSASFSPTLALSGNVTEFTLSNFGVRYQSIDGNGFRGDSGTGRGTYYVAPPEPPRKVSEPATLAAIGLFVVGSLQVKKKKSLLSV
ncbi:MAG: cistern family PEP-CTERM protein [Nodularia sp. (in: cyanobacteria)]|nr:cistern family PEP-CTERM protein [Nodularia sp. (in: cyanobacteria)]